MGIVTYYLNKDHNSQSTLIGLKEVLGNYKGANVAKIIIPIISDIIPIDRLGFF
jgi:hypothetical protein